MQIEAGRMITEAMQVQRDRDFLSLVVYDTIVGSWRRISQKLIAGGWIDPQPMATTVDEAFTQQNAAIEQLGHE